MPFVKALKVVFLPKVLGTVSPLPKAASKTMEAKYEATTETDKDNMEEYRDQ